MQQCCGTWHCRSLSEAHASVTPNESSLPATFSFSLQLTSALLRIRYTLSAILNCALPVTLQVHRISHHPAALISQQHPRHQKRPKHQVGSFLAQWVWTEFELGVSLHARVWRKCFLAHWAGTGSFIVHRNRTGQILAHWIWAGCYLAQCIWLWYFPCALGVG